jgi:hypothetical protein
MFKKRNYEENPNPRTSYKWKQKEGSTCDDIIFTNGVREITFDEWIKIRIQIRIKRKKKHVRKTINRRFKKDLRSN